MLEYKDLIVWQKAFDLSLHIYKATEQFPEVEKFGLQSQMRRAAVSIPSNIAEGSRRGTHKDYISFLRVADGSAAELETQLLLAHALKYMSEPQFTTSQELLMEVRKMLPSVIGRLQSSS